MSIWTRAKAKWDELLGRAEQLYGESHGDAAAEFHGEAVRLEGEALENGALENGALENGALENGALENGAEAGDGAGAPRPPRAARPDDTRPTA